MTGLIDLPAGTPWDLQLGYGDCSPEAPDTAPSTAEPVTVDQVWWSPRRAINVPLAEGLATEAEPSQGHDATPSLQGPTLALPVWPLVEVEGRVRTKPPSGSEPTPAPALPESLTLQVEQPPLQASPSPIPLTRFDCPVSPEGQLRCRLPADLLDLSLRAPGFAPVYRWGRDLRTSSGRRLGDLVLEPGASLAGWVDGEPQGELTFDPEKATLRLSAELASGGGDPLLAERLRRDELSTRPDERGFFQLDGVRPGLWALEVEHPGFATARVTPLEILGPVETRLPEPIVLRPPLDFELIFDPPVDWLGEPWQVEVRRGTDWSERFASEPVAAGPLDELGSLQVTEQSAGRFQVTVSDSLENRWLTEPDLHITGAGDTVRHITLEVVEVRGRVTRGDDPVPGVLLQFGGHYGSRRAGWTSDDDGDYEGFLPGTGHYPVVVEPSPNRSDEEPPTLEQPVRLRALVEEPGPSGWTRLDLEIPDTRIFGRVVDSEDRPVKGATVVAAHRDGSAEVSTDSSGEFLLDAVPHGEVQLAAQVQGPSPATSEREELLLTEGQPSGPWTLRLGEDRQVSGRVVGPRGPLGGAVVWIASRTGPWATGSRPTRTDLQGRFRTSIAGWADGVVATIAAAGQSLTVTETSPEEATAGDWMIATVPEGGTLQVQLPPMEEILTGRLHLEIFRDDLPLPMAALTRWIESHGGGLPDRDQTLWTIPRLAPGEYRACLDPDPRLEIGPIAPASSQRRCAAGYLGSGGLLELTVEAASGL